MEIIGFTDAQRAEILESHDASIAAVSALLARLIAERLAITNAPRRTLLRDGGPKSQERALFSKEQDEIKAAEAAKTVEGGGV